MVIIREYSGYHTSDICGYRVRNIVVIMQGMLWSSYNGCLMVSIRDIAYNSLICLY